jgi:hypothetical protein
MSKFAIPLALTAVVLVSACAHRAAPAPVVVVPQQPAVIAAPSSAPVVVQAASLRAGYGRVESISAIPTSSGAGSTAPGAMRRLTIRMEDGTMQYVDSDAPNVAVGDRVQLTADGYIRPA